MTSTTKIKMKINEANELQLKSPLIQDIIHYQCIKPDTQSFTCRYFHCSNIQRDTVSNE